MPTLARPRAATPPASPVEVVHERRTPWLLPLAILILGLVLRAYGAWRHPFEEDELYTLIEARALFDSPLQPGIEARPLFFLLQHLVLEMAPPSAPAMRMLPLLVGVLGVWATWRLAERIFGGTIAAPAAAFLVAIAPWHLHASGMARYWSLIYLLAALFFEFLLRAYQTDRPRLYLLAFAALLLGLLSHPTFVFPVTGAVLALALVGRDGRVGWSWPSRSAWTLLWIPAALCVAAGWLALTLIQREDAIRNFDGRGWAATLRLLPAIVEWLTPTIVLVAVMGAVLLLRGGSTPLARRWGAVALAGVGSTLAALAGASLVTNVYADYAMPMLPLVFVTLGGLVHLGAQHIQARPGVFALTAVATLTAAMLPSVVSHLSDGMRFDFRPAFAHVRAAAPDALLLSAPTVLQREYAPDLNGRELRLDPAYLDAALREAGDLWLVLPIKRYGTSLSDPTGKGMAWVARRCQRVEAFERPRLDFRMYRTELHHCSAAW